MGYHSFAPGANNRVCDSLTSLEKALRALPLDKYEETLELIQRLTQNVVRNGAEEKFRRIKLSNPKIAAAITEVPNAVELLKAMGWQDEQGELVLPSAVHFAHEREVVAIIDAKDWYKKECEAARKRQAQALKEKDPDKVKLLQQMEADRKEKQAEGPVTKSSVAKKMGDGPNIMRAADLGIGKNAGG